MSEEVNTQVDQNTEVQGEDGQQETQTLSQEEANKLAEQEAERRVAKARAKWEESMKEKLEEAKSEGEKLAKMSAQEKADQAAKKQAEEMKAREEALNKRELTASVRDELADKNLPSDLADTLVSIGDAEQISKAIVTLDGLIAERVNQEVNQKLQGSGKPQGGASPLTDEDDPFSKVMKKYNK
ncbi:DUF4355 domain-containing protein [Fructobacillus cardui]|uniref:DUF4355 domain-containing protein n=1 Tax=Fructobacillus cardui TaxID=2893170 RepID=UPI002D9A00CB|nr:hypothetical protein R53653_IHELHDKM_01575 [Fructobacillus cardui]